jgi:hypothetical protein
MLAKVLSSAVLGVDACGRRVPGSAAQSSTSRSLTYAGNLTEAD